MFIFIASNLSVDIEAQKKACNEKCHKIIHVSAVEAAGSAAALSQFPGADNLALALLIGKMVIDLSNVYDILKQCASLGNGANAAIMSALVEYIGLDVAENFERQKFEDT